MSGKVLILGGVFMAASFVGADALFQYGTMETERFTVVETETVNVGSGEDLHKEKRISVILENGCPETFTVEDSFWHGQFYSSNLHAIFADAVSTEGREDNTFEVTHYGWRNGFFSMMENVISADHISDGPYELRSDAPTACRL